VALAFFGSKIRSDMREVFGRSGGIELTSSEIVLDSPNLFREPLRVPLSQVRLVSFDDSGNQKRRFPVGGGGPVTGKKDRASWLWRKDREAALPVLELNPMDEVPNLAIVFDPPVEIAGQKTLKTFLTHPASFVDRRIRVVSALVGNEMSAKASFDEIGLLRSPTTEDFAALPLSAEEKRQRRLYTLIAIASFVLIFGGGLVLFVATAD
jgi:hypothetical protein